METTNALQGLKEVDEETFFNTVMPVDSVFSITTDYPFTTEYRMRSSRRLLGKSVDEHEDEYKASTVTKYYIASE